MNPNLSPVLVLSFFILAAPLRAKEPSADAPMMVAAGPEVVRSSEFLEWSQVKPRSGGNYACAGGTGWVMGFTPAAMAWKRQRKNPPQSLQVYCLYQQGAELMKRPVPGAFLKIDYKGVRVEDGSRQVAAAVQPYSRPGFEKAIRDGSGAVAAPPPTAAPAAVETKKAKTEPPETAAMDPKKADLARPLDDDVSASAPQAKNFEEALDFLFPDKTKEQPARELLKRFVKDPKDRQSFVDEVNKAGANDWAASQIGDHPREMARLKKARIRELSDRCDKIGVPQGSPENPKDKQALAQLKQRDAAGSAAIGASTDEEASAIIELEKDAGMGPLTQEERLCHSPAWRSQSAGSMGGSPVGNGRSDITGGVPSPEGEKKAPPEPGFLDKWGKPIGAGVGALVGLGIFLAIGGGPLGLLAIGGLALAGWFAGGSASKVGSFFSSSSSASAPSSPASEPPPQAP